MADTDKMECQICTETYNKSNRRKFSCDKPGCQETCCMSCFERWCLDPANDSAGCMFCNSIFTQTQLKEKTPATLQNKILEHRAKMMLSRERSLLPSTQPYVVARKKEIEINEKINTIKTENEFLLELITSNKMKIEKLASEIRTDQIGLTTDRKVFKLPCPDSKCKGFVSSGWKCSLCEEHFCRHCHEKKTEGHVCDEGKKATIAMIKNDCKPCPECYMPIEKLEGCDQMFCTNPGCNTPFSWRTGNKITNGPIHNPHYFELLRRGGQPLQRQPGDVPCGGVPTPQAIDKVSQPPNVIRTMINCARLIPHITEVVIPNFPTEHNPDTNQNMRVDYCLDKLTVKAWTGKLKASIKKIDYHLEIVAVLNCITNSLTDILQRFVRNSKDIVDEVKILNNYVNEQFTEIGQKYKYVPLSIPTTWVTVYKGKTAIGYMPRAHYFNGNIRY